MLEIQYYVTITLISASLSAIFFKSAFSLALWAINIDFEVPFTSRCLRREVLKVQQPSQQSDSAKELSTIPQQVVANQAVAVFNPETCEAT